MGEGVNCSLIPQVAQLWFSGQSAGREGGREMKMDWGRKKRCLTKNERRKEEPMCLQNKF